MGFCENFSCCTDLNIEQHQPHSHSEEDTDEEVLHVPDHSAPKTDPLNPVQLPPGNNDGTELHSESGDDVQSPDEEDEAEESEGLN